LVLLISFCFILIGRAVALGVLFFGDGVHRNQILGQLGTKMSMRTVRSLMMSAE
jgi:hypothetical protein